MAGVDEIGEQSGEPGEQPAARERRDQGDEDAADEIEDATREPGRVGRCGGGAGRRHTGSGCLWLL